MNPIIFDIETAPNDLAVRKAELLRSRAYPYEERFPPKNYSRPETIAEWRAKDEAEWPRTCEAEANAFLDAAALSPRYARIIAVGAVEVASRDTSRDVAVDLGDERELICAALDALSHADPLVTFNGMSFDVPLLHVRAAVHGLRLQHAPDAFLRRYTTQHHADLRLVLANWDARAAGTLHDWCEAFGIESTDECSGADIGALVSAGDTNGIAKHCAEDLRLTCALYERLTTAGVV